MNALTFGLLAVKCAVASPITRGHIFEPSRAADAPLFQYETSSTQSDTRKETLTRYRDPQGKIVVEEETVLEKDKLQRYSIKQIQTNESGTIEVKDGKVSYQFTAQGKVSSDNEEWTPQMIVPDQIPEIIQSRFSDLEKGDDVKIRLLLVELQDSFGFNMFKTGDTKIGETPALEIKVKPSSFFIAALVDPIRLVVEKAKPHRILRMTGRLPVRVAEKIPPQSRKDWKALDGRLEFLYSSP